MGCCMSQFQLHLPTSETERGSPDKPSAVSMVLVVSFNESLQLLPWHELGCQQVPRCVLLLGSFSNE